MLNFAGSILVTSKSLMKILESMTTTVVMGNYDEDSLYDVQKSVLIIYF